ncbi:hypothetical protein TNCV_4279081 [Trichonephila clavipes]|nr:hypothetical protein TNCV_4279081 [Trichonephila clavipes]
MLPPQFSIKQVLEPSHPPHWEKRLVALTTAPYCLVLNPREVMDVCKCLVLVLHWSTLNIHRSSSPLERLVGGEQRRVAPVHPLVLDESRSCFRVHTGYFSNIPKCIKAEFIASWGCSQSSVVSSSQR